MLINNNNNNNYIHFKGIRRYARDTVRTECKQQSNDEEISYRKNFVAAISAYGVF